jgi:hypothetical protein
MHAFTVTRAHLSAQDQATSRQGEIRDTTGLVFQVPTITRG